MGLDIPGTNPTAFILCSYNINMSSKGSLTNTRLSAMQYKLCGAQLLIAHPSWGGCWSKSYMGSSPDSPPCESLTTRDQKLIDSMCACSLHQMFDHGRTFGVMNRFLENCQASVKLALSEECLLYLTTQASLAYQTVSLLFDNISQAHIGRGNSRGFTRTPLLTSSQTTILYTT